jgi:transcriptional regulator with XRE-family HTH domain
MAGKKHILLGKRIQQLRKEKDLSIKALANETGFSEDFLKQVESNKITPPVGALLKISRAMGVDSGLLLKEEEEAGERRREESYRKRTEAYSYRTLTPEARNKHLKAFSVYIEPMSEHPGVEYQHEGEEFVYVLQGTIEVIVGENPNRLNRKESLHFNSSIVHKLRNVGKENAELLVVLYTP